MRVLLNKFLELLEIQCSASGKEANDMLHINMRGIEKGTKKWHSVATQKLGEPTL